MSKKYYLAVGVLATLFLIMAWGCSAKNRPSDSVLSFISAVKNSDAAGIEKTLMFERLVLEKEGDSYLKLPPDARKKEAESFKKNLIANLTTGNLKSFGEIDPKVSGENISGEEAEVLITDMKNNKTFRFALEREGGAWKIFRISPA